MVAAALAAGNPVVLKPAPQTPIVAARLVSLLYEAGLPCGALHFLPGCDEVIGDYLVDHPAVRVIAFTGSREVGCRILERAAVVQPGQRHIKRVIAEMGGKNAIVVDRDADLDEAVFGALMSAFSYAGQKCSAASRIIIVKEVYEVFRERFVEATSSVRIGDPTDPDTFLGPVIDGGAKERIECAVEEGATASTLLYRGDVSRLGPGAYVGPAVFGDVKPESQLAQQEIFGPVVALMRAETFDHAISLANGTPYGLTGGLYSRRPTHIDQAKRDMEVGNLYVNRKITGALVARQPFGGLRLSGAGNKTGGPDYLLQFLEPRTVTENTMRRGVTSE
jgi:RHH-type proline utilization regulon transcriptional repressor/proline dehydrogenase/delta 1-pyrroline-5-carboxylate dehydrogenase